MAEVLKPRLSVEGHPDRRGGRAFAGSGDDYGQRLMKYIPLKVSGLFPILDSALDSYIKDPIAGISPYLLNLFVIILLLLAIVIEVNRAYDRANITGPTRWRIQSIQTVFNIFAFILWTYTVKGGIWDHTNNPALVVILDGLFLLFAQYIPDITRDEAQQAGFTVSAPEDSKTLLDSRPLPPVDPALARPDPVEK
jgi:hypothetical protein